LGLASQRIASFRFDSRSHALGAEEIAGMNLDRYLMGDIAALLAYIRMQPNLLTPAAFTVAGYGLGGLVAPEIARRDSNLAGVILLSAAARPPHEILMTPWTNMRIHPIRRPQDRRLNDPRLKLSSATLERTLPPDQIVLFASPRSGMT